MRSRSGLVSRPGPDRTLQTCRGFGRSWAQDPDPVRTPVTTGPRRNVRARRPGPTGHTGLPDIRVQPSQGAYPESAYAGQVSPCKCEAPGTGVQNRPHCPDRYRTLPPTPGVVDRERTGPGRGHSPDQNRASRTLVIRSCSWMGSHGARLVSKTCRYGVRLPDPVQRGSSRCEPDSVGPYTD